MAIVKIECPNCRAKFTLKAPSLESMANKPFRCPKCGFVAPFGKLINRRGASAPLHTNISGDPNAQPVDKTRIAASGAPLVELVIEENGKSLKLGSGIYTIGRDSSDSRASLKVSPDKYMSRMHAQIEVNSNPTGHSKPICHISGLNATNPTFVNNRKIEAGESIELKNGDKILLGLTKINVKM